MASEALPHWSASPSPKPKPRSSRSPSPKLPAGDNQQVLLESPRREPAEACKAPPSTGKVTVKYSMYAEQFDIEDGKLEAKTIDELYCLSFVMPGCFIHMADKEFAHDELHTYIPEEPPGTIVGLIAGQTYWCYVQQDPEQERRDQLAMRERRATERIAERREHSSWLDAVMGPKASTGPMDAQTIRRVFDPTNCFKAAAELDHTPGCDALAAYCILGGQQTKRTAAADSALKRYCDSEASAALDRSLGCMLGNVIGDALGAPLEFSPVRYGVLELTGLDHDEIWKLPAHARLTLHLEPGQWTDDAAMALCLLDSLLCCGKLDGADLRQRFYLWLKYGYNNAFGRGALRPQERNSIGVGTNIQKSIDEWELDPEHRKPYTLVGDEHTSSNGSLMRNAPIPVCFHSDLEAGLQAASQQSRTTHQGEEAAELCRLLTFICISFINGAGRQLLEDLSSFQSPLYTVTCLAAATCEETHVENSDAIAKCSPLHFGGLDCRRWDWRSPNYQYCQKRAEETPTTVGSYSMDCMAMALHCVYLTDTFEAATLKAVNLRGDADTVGAVVGQIAGALYGASAIPSSWSQRVQQWDGGTIAARALMLHNRETLGKGEALSDAACATASLLGKAYL